VGGSEKSLFLWSGGYEKNRLFTADVQNDAPSHSRMHAVVLSSDQRPCWWCSAECFPAYQWLAAWSRWRNFTSEQNKVSKSDVVEKIISVANFWMSADVMCKKYENWWTRIKAIGSQTWDVFWDTLYVARWIGCWMVWPYSRNSWVSLITSTLTDKHV